MRTPCEWTLSDFVPRIRRELVKELHKNRGMSQKDISKLLGISQPRVSQYLALEKKQKRNISPEKAKLIDFQLNDTVEVTVKNIIQLLDEGKSSPETIPIICRGCRKLRMANALCSLHRLDYPELDDSVGSNNTCDLCLKWKDSTGNNEDSLESLDARFNVLKVLESISSMLIMKLSFPDFIPQIGAQICLIYENPDESNKLEDVAAFPGRIIQVQGTAKIVSRPEYNSSKTTGSLLLEVRKFNKNIQAVLSIKSKDDQDFENRLISKNFTIIKTRALDENEFSENIEPGSLAHSKIAIIDSGSIGYEPITYLLVENITDLVDVFD